MKVGSQYACGVEHWFWNDACVVITTISMYNENTWVFERAIFGEAHICMMCILSAVLNTNNTELTY